MRTILLAAAALLVSGSAALAAPASVSVAIGPKLQAKAEKTYGVRDVRDLADRLQKEVARTLTRTGAYDGARLELVLADAVPNRPTFKQLSDTPGLSYQSFGVGGAAIEGRIVAADGTVTPVSYSYYEPDIRYAAQNWTWHDADWTFGRLASKLGRAEVVANR
ncbi:MAG: hypothetical protein ABI655_12185 [Phenylobacterium sp.]